MTNATTYCGAVAAGRRRALPVQTAVPVQTARPAQPVRPVRPARTRSQPVSWPARVLILAAVAMIPWLVYLAATLPSTTSAAHWDAVWVGLDAAEAAGLLATGLLLRRHDPRRSLTAAATATLLAVDAWFDCGTAAPGGERLIALAMAAGLELPLAVFLAVLAWRAFPQSSASA